MFTNEELFEVFYWRVELEFKKDQNGEEITEGDLYPYIIKVGKHYHSVGTRNAYTFRWGVADEVEFGTEFVIGRYESNPEPDSETSEDGENNEYLIVAQNIKRTEIENIAKEILPEYIKHLEDKLERVNQVAASRNSLPYAKLAKFTEQKIRSWEEKLST